MIMKMIKCVILFINIMAISGICKGCSGTIEMRNSSSIIEDLLDEVSTSITNNNNSIQYHLYTPENTKEFCYFEPEESNNCSFDETYKTKVLIHGYTVQLLPGNLYEQIKDTLLKYNKYNVIIVNWTQYDGYPYAVAVSRAYIVAINVGKMLNFLVSNRRVNSSDIHIIGHSLGAHIAGVAGRQVQNLGRITGLDPAGQLHSKAVKYNRLTYTSADFVDVMHTSNYQTGEGRGLSDAIGSIDIYPNGGNKQPACKIGGTFSDSDGTVTKIKSEESLGLCYHDIVLNYFMNSIHKCNYICMECTNYRQYSQGKCNYDSNLEDKMGLYCAPIPGLPVESTFYLNTATSAPYC